MSINILQQPHGTIRLGNFLLENLNDAKWKVFRSAIAFVKQSGTKHIKAALQEFAQRAEVKIAVGIDSGGTSFEGLTDLRQALPHEDSLWVFHNANYSTFHPKVYLFKNDDTAVLVVGSGNLTEGGLFTNYEASLQVKLDLSVDTDRSLLADVESMLDVWASPVDGLCFRLTEEFLQQLTTRENVPTEAQSRENEEGTRKSATSTETSIFKRHAVPPAPSVRRVAEDDVEEVVDEEEEGVEVIVPEPAPPQGGANHAFYMTLQKTDVGVGQTTAGTSRRSPEIFIPLVARNADPDFWGWPDSFVADPDWDGPVDKDGRGKMDRFNVRVRLGTEIIDVNMWYNPDKRDMRIRSESLRSAGNIGDILRVERADGVGGFSYYIEVIPAGTSRYPSSLALCVNDVKGLSLKRWGYV